MLLKAMLSQNQNQKLAILQIKQTDPKKMTNKYDTTATWTSFQELCLMGWNMSSLLPSDSWGDVVFALVVVSVADEILTHVLHLAASEGRAVVKPSVQDSRLPSQQLNQLPHLTGSHTHTQKCNNESIHNINIFVFYCPNTRGGSNRSLLCKSQVSFKSLYSSPESR